MADKHTPGPWVFAYSNDVGPDDDYFIEFFELSTTDGRVLARVEEEPDARLIAAAPDLLEALKVCEENISSLLASQHPKVFGIWLDSVRAAIAKATGSKP
jgi:hypothetical protein